MKETEGNPDRADRVAVSQAMSAPDLIPPPDPDADSIEEVVDNLDRISPEGAKSGGLFGARGRRSSGDKRVDTQTSIERVREMVAQGSARTRMVNISVFLLMAMLGLILIGKAMSPAALEGGVKEGRTVVNDVLKQ